MPARKTNDLPFPSFSLAMSQYLTSDLRLPSYRTSHLLRFHPYPRTKLSSREIVMQTVDDRVTTQCEIAEENEIAQLGPLIFADLQEEDNLNAVNLQEAIEVPEAGAEPRVRRPSLTSLIIDLALQVARKLSLKTK